MYTEIENTAQRRKTVHIYHESIDKNVNTTIQKNIKISRQNNPYNIHVAGRLGQHLHYKKL